MSVVKRWHIFVTWTFSIETTQRRTPSIAETKSHHLPRRAILTFAPVFKDISNVVRYIKNGKAPRSDSKPTRVLKQKMKMTLRCLHRIFLIHEHWGNVRLQRCLYHYELSEEKFSQLTIAIMEYFFPNITRNFFCFDS